MSATAGIWKQIRTRAVSSPGRAQTETASAAATTSESNVEMLGLARRIFFPSAEVQRTHVLFAASDAETDISTFCKRMGVALRDISSGMVAIVEATRPLPVAAPRKRGRNQSLGTAWRDCSVQLAEQVWSIPSALFCAQDHSRERNDWTLADMKEIHATFGYVLFAARMSDSEMPMFSRASDAAVLVLDANRTRREAALRAKEELQHFHAELLGAVLNGRTLPIPEFLYRRL